MDDRLWTLRDAGGGATQFAVRNHNERIVLALIRAEGTIASADIARATNLSAQTASVITRALENEGFIKRGDPVKGKVGKPMVPFEIDPEGVVSFGLRIGRRSADFTQIDLRGGVRGHAEVTYAYPTPAIISDFVGRGLDGLPTPRDTSRVAGLGIGSPFELWNWLELLDANSDDMNLWRDFDLTRDLADVTDLPVRLGNDINMSAFGELHFGNPRGLSDFAYFYVGSLGGGGVIMDGRLLEGPTRNAGAFGSLPIYTETGGHSQLNRQASIYLLERRAQDAGHDPDRLWQDAGEWGRLGPILEDWLWGTAEAFAAGIVAVTAVLDLPFVVIDGSVPSAVRADLTERVVTALTHQDHRGIAVPEVVEGSLGRLAGAYGAAHKPLASRYLLD